MRRVTSTRLAVPLEHRASRRGFTMVELMVALTGGLFVSLAVFVLAKHSSRFYQRELRVGNATMSSLVGFERLRGDLARAGFMSSANIQRDPTLCGPPVRSDSQERLANWQAGIQRLASVIVEPITSGLPASFTAVANGLAPDKLTVMGNYSSVDHFPIRQIDVGDGVHVIYLQRGVELANIGYSGGSDDLPSLQAVFRPGRLVRIVDKRGKTQYSFVESVADGGGGGGGSAGAGAGGGSSGGGNPMITVTEYSQLPKLQTMEDEEADGDYNCGVHGHETGAFLNPVDIYQYDLRKLDTVSAYAPVYAAQGAAFESDRRELVRTELNPRDGVTRIDGTDELVAEYAVDVRFLLTVAQTTESDLLRVPASDNTAWAGAGAGKDPNRGAHRVRNVRTWLSVRSREPDRLDTTATSGDGPLLRIGLSNLGGAPYARVRTVQAYVALRNQIGNQWP